MACIKSPALMSKASRFIWWPAMVCAAASVTMASVVGQGSGGVHWRYHAWDPTSRTKHAERDYTEQLPISEQDALSIICRTLSALPPDAHLLAVSGSAFHPALNSVCRVFNLTCVYTGAGEGEQLSGEWLHNAVRLFPAPELRSRSIADYVAWAMWNNFVVLYCNFHDLEKVQALVDFPLGPALFRPMNLSDPGLARLQLRQLRLSTMHRFVVDMQLREVTEFFKQAWNADLTGMGHSFLLVSEITERFFKRDVAPRLKHGVNFTSHQFDGVRLLGRAANRTTVFQALDILLDSAYADWLLNGSSPPVFADAAPAESSGLPQFCLPPLTVRVGEFHPLLENQIRNQLGTVQLDGRQFYNFSFSVSQMRRSRTSSGRLRIQNKKFAVWTADKGYQLTGLVKGSRTSQSSTEVNISVVTVIDPPFSFEQDFDEDGLPLTGNDRWTGMAIELFKEIARQLNISYTISISSDGKFGGQSESKSGDITWSGTVGDLMSGKADVAVASLVITYDREMVIDFTTPYLSLGLSVITKKSEQQTDPLQFMLPFSRRVWLYMLTAWLLTSFIMFLIARLSPYEWYSHSDCAPVVENQFSALNSMWFTIGSLMQQGSDLAPRASSTRMVATTWWFFTLLLISSYTANLAAFLTTSRMEAINSIDDLASQSKVKFGCATGGATYNFFKNSKLPLYKKMWDSMVTWSANNESFVGTTAEGISRVEKGGYAYVIESTFNQFYRERDCDLTQIGGIFNPGSYAFAVSQGNADLRDDLSEVILKLHKEQFIEQLSETWIKRFNISGQPCSEDSPEQSNTGTLDLVSFGGVFVSMLAGFGIAIALCALELVWRSYVLASRTGNSFISLCLEQLRLAKDVKVNRKSPIQNSAPPCACNVGTSWDRLALATRKADSGNALAEANIALSKRSSAALLALPTDELALSTDNENAGSCPAQLPPATDESALETNSTPAQPPQANDESALATDTDEAQLPLGTDESALATDTDEAQLPLATDESAIATGKANFIGSFENISSLPLATDDARSVTGASDDPRVDSALATDVVTDADPVECRIEEGSSSSSRCCVS